MDLNNETLAGTFSEAEAKAAADAKRLETVITMAKHEGRTVTPLKGGGVMLSQPEGRIALAYGADGKPIMKGGRGLSMF